MHREYVLLLASLLCTTTGCYDTRTTGVGTGSEDEGRAQAGSAAQSDAASDAREAPAAAGSAPDASAEDGGIMLECSRGPVSALRVEFECSSLTVYTCKDLSNVVLEFEDGTRQRFEGLNGHINTFAGTDEHAGKRVVGVWVKAGANHSGDGPGYGQRVDTTIEECDPPAAGSGGGGAGGACAEGPDVPCNPGPSGGVGGGSGPGLDPQ